MNKKELMAKFIKRIQSKKMLTIFIKNLFNYYELNEYNYMFRMKEYQTKIIIDIYDNISNNHFNRYIFNFYGGDYGIRVEENNNVFVTLINVEKITKYDSKLLKFVHMFQLDDNDILAYAKTFLEEEIVNILNEIINKPIFE